MSWDRDELFQPVHKNVLLHVVVAIILYAPNRQMLLCAPERKYGPGDRPKGNDEYSISIRLILMVHYKSRMVGFPNRHICEADNTSQFQLLCFRESFAAIQRIDPKERISSSSQNHKKCHCHFPWKWLFSSQSFVVSIPWQMMMGLLTDGNTWRQAIYFGSKIDR